MLITFEDVTRDALTGIWCCDRIKRKLLEHTLLIKNEDIATVQVDGVSGTQAGHYTTEVCQSRILGEEGIMRGRGDLHPPPTTITWGAAIMCVG
jgi:hypothetical protein